MESFENRVDKIFGTLNVTSSWRLDPTKPRLDLKPPSTVQDNDDDDEEEEEERSCWADRHQDEQDPSHRMDVEDDVEEEARKMRQMIGLDTTLDFEDEEDEFDKAAFGREGSEDRLYMMGIKDVDRKVNASNSLPLSLYDLKNVQRDPRANHSAARARLEEDARAAATVSAESKSREETTQHNNVADEQRSDAANEKTTGVKRRNEPRIDAPVLEQASFGSIEEKGKPPKRVRFTLDPQEPEECVQKQLVKHKPNSSHASQVPDHVRNPSKYTHYTLDWSVEENDWSNFAVYKAFDENLRKNTAEECVLAEENTDKIQYIPKHGRTFGNLQKSDAEVNQSNVQISKTMCLDLSESDLDKVEMVSDDAMDFQVEESTSGFHMIARKNSGVAAKNFRLKREVEDEAHD